jgi:hypothetical protein
LAKYGLTQAVFHRAVHCASAFPADIKNLTVEYHQLFILTQLQSAGLDGIPCTSAIPVQKANAKE